MAFSFSQCNYRVCNAARYWKHSNFVYKCAQVCVCAGVLLFRTHNSATTNLLLLVNMAKKRRRAIRVT